MIQLINMTHAYLGLKNHKGVVTIEKGHQYLTSEQSRIELGMDLLVEQKIIKELSEEEALKNYRQTLK